MDNVQAVLGFAGAALQGGAAGLRIEGADHALVNGTRPWRLFWCIELPQLAPTLLTAVLIRFIDGFRVFDNIYALMGSGPGGSTLSMSIYIYESFFKSAQLGKAMAASVMLFVAAFALLYALGRWVKREPS